MIPDTSMLFSNIFDDYRITPFYIERFAYAVIASLTKNNTNGDYDAALIPLQNAMIPFKAKLGLVDTSFNSQTGKTATLDKFKDFFSSYMKDNYVMIAAKLGGEKTPSFKEFYPNKKTEYHQITKTKMPVVVRRLKTAAEKYEALLGAEITADLVGFEARWETLRKDQLEKMAAVKTNRQQKVVARRNLEMQLLYTIHFIGCKFPGDEAQCKQFFDFNLLFPARHKSKEKGKTTNDTAK